MGVPEELRVLDDELAAGRVDAAAYRRRRDDLLAARTATASSARSDEVDDPGPGATEEDPDPVPEGPVVPGPRPPGSVSAPPLPGPRPPASTLRPPPGGDAAPAGHPATPDPFPPPFRWGPLGPDVTQIVSTGSGGAAGAGEVTQVVRGVGEHHERTTTAATTDRTRVVPGAAVARSVARSTVPAVASAPPWTAGPPTRMSGSSAQLQRRQGAEVFVHRGTKPAVLISTTLVVLVAALVLVASVVLA